MFSISTKAVPVDASLYVPSVVSDLDASVHSSASSARAPTSVIPRTAPRDACQVLPNVLWGQIAELMPRNDVLTLRTVHRAMAGWVDRSIRSLHVQADKMPAMLAVVGRSGSLKHIDALTVAHCTLANLPPAIAALATLPHAKLDLIFDGTETGSRWALDETAFGRLQDIRPASLSIKICDVLSLAQIRQLADLTYPICLEVSTYGRNDAEKLHALASIPKLLALDVGVYAAIDDLAEAFQQHDYLQTLCIRAVKAPFQERGLVALAGNQSLVSLTIIDDTSRHALDARGVAILSESTTLETLSVSLRDGCGQLARMASLKSLTLKGYTSITPDDARLFAQRAHLKSLDISDARFKQDALAIMASAAVEHLKISVAVLDEEAFSALLANRTLRSLHCRINGAHARAVERAKALAAHPTLGSLVLLHTKDYERPFFENDERFVFSVMTEAERAGIYAAWGEHRLRTSLKLHF